MSEFAIRVERLGKRYRLGARQIQDRTLRDSIPVWFTRPLRLLGAGLRTGSWLTKPVEDYIWAFRDVSLDVKHGEVLGVIGRNGAGKSTLLKILSRITAPTEGRAVIEGRLGSLLEVGTGFHGDLSGRDNIFLNGALLGMRRWEIKKRFDAIVAFAEVDRFIDTPVKHYSSGMYMRLAFAVAAHLDPDVLIVDEVLAVGDAAFQKKCLGKMSDVARQGRTVLFVSHNMNAVEQLCSAAVCFEPGRPPELRHDTRAVIHDYLFGSGPDGPGAGEWLNAGDQFKNPLFTPLRFAVTDRHGRRLEMPVANSDDIWVQIEARIEVTDPGLVVGYTVQDETGTYLYCSYQTDGPQEQWPALGRGTRVLRSPIPPRLLNEGVYRLELAAGLHQRQPLFDARVGTAAVWLIVRGSLSDSPMWREKRQGVIAPVIRWVSGT